MTSSKPDCNFYFKFIIIGNSCVGKSCLLERFLEKKFRPSHEVTIGVECGSQTIDVNGKLVSLQIWDTAGQEAYRSVARSYYRGSTAALLVYDVTNRLSFNSLPSWLSDARDFGSESLVAMAVGNKVDLGDAREVTRDEGEAFARENRLLFIETSAKTSQNVDEAFVGIAREIISKIQSKIIDPRTFPGIKLGPQELKAYGAPASSNGNAAITATGSPASPGSGGGCC